MAGGVDLGYKAGGARFRHHLVSVLGQRGGPHARIAHIARRPGCQHMACIAGVRLPAQKMIRAVQADKAFGVLGADKDPAGVVDGDKLIQGCVHDQEGLTERAQAIGERLGRDVVQELALDQKGAAGQPDGGCA